MLLLLPLAPAGVAPLATGESTLFCVFGDGDELFDCVSINSSSGLPESIRVNSLVGLISPHTKFVVRSSQTFHFWRLIFGSLQ